MNPLFVPRLLFLLAHYTVFRDQASCLAIFAAKPSQ